MMRVTRRGLLGLIGLGAVAAALAPIKAVEAAESCHQCQPDSPFPHVYGHGVGVEAVDTLAAYLVGRCADQGCMLSVGPNLHRYVWSAVHSHPNEHVQSWLLDIDYVDIVRDSSSQAKRLADWVDGCHADALKVVNAQHWDEMERRYAMFGKA